MLLQINCLNIQKLLCKITDNTCEKRQYLEKITKLLAKLEMECYYTITETQKTKSRQVRGGKAFVKHLKIDTKCYLETKNNMHRAK